MLYSMLNHSHSHTPPPAAAAAIIRQSGWNKYEAFEKRQGLLEEARRVAARCEAARQGKVGEELDLGSFIEKSYEVL